MYKRCENCVYCSFNSLSCDYYCTRKHTEVDPDDSCMYYESTSTSNSSPDSDDLGILGIPIVCAYFCCLGVGLLEVFKRFILPLVLPTSLIVLVLYVMYKIVRKTDASNIDKIT